MFRPPGNIFFSGEQAIYHFATWLFRMRPEAKAVGRRKRPRFPPVVSKKDKKKSPRKRGRATRSSGRGSSRGSQPSRRSSSSDGDEPAPAPAPAPAADSSDAESSDEELPDGFKKEYHPEGMLAARKREAEVIRRERLSGVRLRRANQQPLPAVPEDPVPAQRGGFPKDWPEEGFPAWFVDQCQKFGHDLDDEANVDALERVVAIYRAIDVRPFVPGRFLAFEGHIENLGLIAKLVPQDRADAIKAAIKALRKADRKCRETDRKKKPPKGACRLCAIVGTLLCRNQPVVRDHPRHQADAVTRSTSRRRRHSNSD